MKRPLGGDIFLKAIESLEAHGFTAEAQRLALLRPAWDSAYESGGWLRHNVSKVVAVVSRHAENARTEAVETGDLLRYARSVLVDGEPVGAPETERARQQMLDLLKTVPASAILAGTFMIPVPGAQPIIAPILMERLGLLPSAWNQSALEKVLRDLLHQARHKGPAELEQLLAQVLEHVKGQRSAVMELSKFVASHPEWRVFFDENGDSKVSEEELSVLSSRVSTTARLAQEAPDQASLLVYLGQGSCNVEALKRVLPTLREYDEDAILGPMSLRSLLALLPRDANALVRWTDELWWVPWPAVAAGVALPME